MKNGRAAVCWFKQKLQVTHTRCVIHTVCNWLYNFIHSWFIQKKNFLNDSGGLLLLKRNKISVFNVLLEHSSMKTYRNHHLMRLGHFVLFKEFIWFHRTFQLKFQKIAYAYRNSLFIADNCFFPPSCYNQRFLLPKANQSISTDHLRTHSYELYVVLKTMKLLHMLWIQSFQQPNNTSDMTKLKYMMCLFVGSHSQIITYHPFVFWSRQAGNETELHKKLLL